MMPCPHCGLWMNFVGIRATTRRWEKWLKANECKFFIVLNSVGKVIGITAEEPKKGYFTGEAVA